MPKRIDRREFLIAGGIAAGLTVTEQNTWAKSVRGAVVSDLTVTDLRVDYLVQPLGLENPQPRLSWRIESRTRGMLQGAFRILVASSDQLLANGQGDLWDSGRVQSANSIGVTYAGLKLASRQRYWWRVQVWADTADPITSSSAPSSWEMGLLEPNDWTAQWVAAEDADSQADRSAGIHWLWGSPQPWQKVSRKFRYTVELPEPASTGQLFAVTNDWWFFTQITRIWIDGQPVAGPGQWIDIAESGSAQGEENVRLSRQQVTVAPMAAGKHVIALEVTTGELWPSLIPEPITPALALTLRLSLRNGKTLSVSRASCKTSLANETDWHSLGYDDTAWEPAQPATVHGYQPMPVQPAMHLRREFAIDKSILRARLYATALGAYEARLNGHRVGDAYLTPEPTQYAERVLYQVFDVASLVKRGPNAIGFTVGDGWYASFDGRYAWAPPPRRVLAQLEVTLSDGSRHVISTDSGWRIAPSPIIEAEIKSGERYDARIEQPGWDLAGFDDAHWEPAQLGESPPCRLVAQVSPPVRIVQRLKPRTITQPKVGAYVIDFGENFSGWCRLRAKGDGGTQIVLKSAELLKVSGEVDQASPIGDPMWQPRTDRFVLRGNAAGEILEPHFTFRSFRYVEITGLKTPPTPNELEGIFIHTDLPITGRIRCDVPLIEQLARASLQTQRSNFVAIPTDNALREVRGWMNDAAAVVWDSAAYNMDVCAFTARVMDNMRDDQGADGAFPMVAPEPRHNNAWYKVSGSPPAWGDCGIILPWTAWRRYGDVGIIEANWEAMNAHLQFIQKHNPDLIWRNKRSNDFGDWMEGSQLDRKANLPPTPKDLLGTAYFARSSYLLSEMAEAIGRTQEAHNLRHLFERIRLAFNKAYVNADGSIGSGSQGSYVLALQFDLLPENVRAAAAQRLASDIQTRNRLITGTVTTQFVLDVLMRSGYTKLVYDLLLKTDFPSWGYMLSQGGTTFWERWDGASARNQMQFGSIGGFLFRNIAGIEAAAPGFKKFLIRPVLDSRVKHAGGDYDSAMGRISTDWWQNPDGSFSLDATIPANTSARIHLPAHPRATIQESGRSIVGREDIRLLQRLAQEAVVEVGSGLYRFVAGRSL